MLGFNLKVRLGSVVTLAEHNGNVLEHCSYGPFGNPRRGDFFDAHPDYGTIQDAIAADPHPPYSSDPRTDRGFTDHEHLDEQRLIHMNGRAYDYNIGRFTSVDPYIQAPSFSQSVNPYSYIMNNPLTGTDPSGYQSTPNKLTEKYVAPTTGSRLKTNREVSDGRGNTATFDRSSGQLVSTTGDVRIVAGAVQIGSNSRAAGNENSTINGPTRPPAVKQNSQEATKVPTEFVNPEGVADFERLFSIGNKIGLLRSDMQPDGTMVMEYLALVGPPVWVDDDDPYVVLEPKELFEAPLIPPYATGRSLFLRVLQRLDVSVRFDWMWRVTYQVQTMFGQLEVIRETGSNMSDLTEEYRYGLGYRRLSDFCYPEMRPYRTVILDRHPFVGYRSELVAPGAEQRSDE